MRTIGIIACLFWFLPSSPVFGFQKNGGWASDFFKPNPGEGSEVFPLAPIQIHEETRRRIEGAGSLVEIFRPIQIVSLEFTPLTAMDQVRRAVFWGGAWVVLTNDGDVFRFSEKGTFLGQLGGRGRGPGEYGRASQIRIIPNNFLAVLDGRMGRILVFDSKCEFLRDIDFRFDIGRINPGDDFIWTEESLYLAAPGVIGQAPLYGMLKFLGGRLEPSHGFGSPVLDFNKAPEKERIFEFTHEGFEMVAGRIWTASPYDIDIQVFDRRGRWLAELPKVKANALHREDFEDFDIQKRGAGKQYLAMMRQIRNRGLIVCGRFVLAGLSAGSRGRTWHLYDDHGNLLKADLPNATPFLFLVGATGDKLVGSHGPEYMSQLFPGMPHTTQELYRASGYNPEKPHDNPVLVIGSLD